MRAREILEAKDPVAVTFGRLNPPTIGHEKLINAVKAASGNYIIYVSESHDSKKNPLALDQKLAYLKQMFPGVNFQSAKTFLPILVDLNKKGHMDIILVVGDDRVSEFETLVNTYNGVCGKAHGDYCFNSIEVKSAGQRDPDAEGAEGMSASKMRAAAIEDDYASFKLGLPQGFKQGEKLFKDVQAGMA
jgi:hypothetical protein